MAVVEVALEDGAPGKLTMSAAFFGEVVLWLDNVELARFTHADLRAAGEKHVPLPDGSVVTVRARGPRDPVLMRNGVPLPSSAADLRRYVLRAAGGLYLFAIVQVCSSQYLLRRQEDVRWNIVLLLLMPVVFAGAGFFATRGLSGILGAAAFFAVDSLEWAVNVVRHERSFFFGLLLRALVAGLLWRGIRAAWELRRQAASPVTSPDS